MKAAGSWHKLTAIRELAVTGSNFPEFEIKIKNTEKSKRKVKGWRKQQETKTERKRRSGRGRDKCRNVNRKCFINSSAAHKHTHIHKQRKTLQYLKSQLSFVKKCLTVTLKMNSIPKTFLSQVSGGIYRGRLKNIFTINLHSRMAEKNTIPNKHLSSF